MGLEVELRDAVAAWVRLSEPVLTVAVAVRVAASAALVATSARAVMPMMMMIRCLMVIRFLCSGWSCLTGITIGGPGGIHRSGPV